MKGTKGTLEQTRKVIFVTITINIIHLITIIRLFFVEIIIFRQQFLSEIVLPSTRKLFSMKMECSML